MPRTGRSRRLRSSAEFAEILKRGRRVSGTRFRVYVKPNAFERARLGMVVAKKVEPKAVRRNQAKRLIRECFRSRQPFLGANDFVVQLRVPLDSRTTRIAAREELNQLFEKAKACRG